MMKKLFFLAAIICLLSCASHPKGFSYVFDGQQTGLDELINIDGYYVTEEKCDSPFFSISMFYPNGMLTLATVSDIDTDLISCFESGGKSWYCDYPSWGTYRIVNDTIKTQVYQDLGIWGGRFIVFRDFVVKSPTEIILVKMHCVDKNVGACNRAPEYECPKASTFFPLETKRDWRESPLLKKKWFRSNQV